jgi:hypothetical protein
MNHARLLVFAGLSACASSSRPASNDAVSGGESDAASLDAAGPDAAPLACDIPLVTTLGVPISAWTPDRRSTTTWAGSTWLHAQVDFNYSQSPDTYAITVAPISRDGIRGAATNLQGQVFIPGLSGVEGMTSAWTGSEDLVAWLYWSNGTNSWETFVGRVGADGGSLGTPVALAVSSGGYDLSSAWSGTQLGLVHGGPLIQLLRIASDGTQIGATTVVGHSEPVPARVAWNGLQFGVTWNDWQGLWFARVSADGLAETPQAIADAIFRATSPPMIIAHGSDWLLAIANTQVVRVFRLSAVGIVQSSFDVPIPDAWTSDYDGHRDYAVAMAPNGQLHVVWVVRRAALEIAYRRVGADGTLLGAPVDLTSHTGPLDFGAQGPELLWSDDGLALTWSDRPAAADDISRYLRSVCSG